jgi:hypothetical protein
MAPHFPAVVAAHARSLLIALIAFAAITTSARVARAFGLEGHEIIEATA